MTCRLCGVGGAMRGIQGVEMRSKESIRGELGDELVILHFQSSPGSNGSITISDDNHNSVLPDTVGTNTCGEARYGLLTTDASVVMALRLTDCTMLEVRVVMLSSPACRCL